MLQYKGEMSVQMDFNIITEIHSKIVQLHFKRDHVKIHYLDVKCIINSYMNLYNQYHCVF